MVPFPSERYSHPNKDRDEDENVSDTFVEHGPSRTFVLFQKLPLHTIRPSVLPLTHRRTEGEDGCGRWGRESRTRWKEGFGVNLLYTECVTLSVLLRGEFPHT